MDASPSAAPAEPSAGAVGRAASAVTAVNRWLHYVAGAALIGLMLLTVTDVLGRTFLNRPFRGTVELTEMVMVVIIYLGFGYAQHRGDHIAVDLVYLQVARTTRLLLTVFNAVFGVAVVGLVTWNLYEFAGRLELGGYTTAVLRIPQGSVALVGVLGGVMFVLALLTTAALAIRSLRQERG